MTTPQEDAALASIADAAQRYLDHVRPTSGEDLWALNITSWMGERMPYVIGRLTLAEQKLARLTEQSDLWHRRELDTTTAMAGIHGELHGVPLPEVGQWDRDRAAEKASREQATAMDTFRAVLDAAGPTPADRAAVLNAAADVALSKQHADHTPDDCAACAMAGVIEYELRRMADAALAAEQPPEPELPRTTIPGRHYLSRFAKETTYVFREPGRPGNGVGRPALERLQRDGLVEVGEYEPLKGKPLQVTDLGRAVLAAHPDGDR